MKSATLEALSANVHEVIPKDGLQQKLQHAKKEGRPLVVKLGLDPTSPDIHLGHSVVLRKLRQFQDAGHTVVLIVGDFTAKIGDPSGRSQTRPVLSDAEIRKNAATYKAQATKILDASPRKLQIRFNSEWLGKLGEGGLLRLMTRATVGQILAREDFRKRMNDGTPIGVHELLYPLLQAQDSIAIEADIEIGGTDQTFNMLMGRELQRAMKMPEQTVLTMPLIVGTDGKRKMSKSYDNYIGVTESAESIFGKVMAVPDALVHEYARLTTDLSLPQLKKLGPLELKKALAKELATLYAGKAAAEKASNAFASTFQNKQFPKDAPTLKLAGTTTLLDFLMHHKLFPSKSEARRKVAEGAVSLDGKKLKDVFTKIFVKKGNTSQLKIGKKSFYKIQNNTIINY